MELITFRVTGVLLDEASHEPMASYGIVVDTGIYDLREPFCLYSIKENRDTNDRGEFSAVLKAQMPDGYVRGDSLPVQLEVHIQFALGQWRYLVVPVLTEQFIEIGTNEYAIDFGNVLVNRAECRTRNKQARRPVRK
jgi:hypothetical protein